MPNRELINCLVAKLLLATQAGATLAQTSASLDTQGFDSAAFDVHYGATAPAPTSVEVQESDDNVSFAAAPATAVVLPTGTHAVSKTARYAYIGAKRYCRIVVTPSAATDVTITGTLGYAAQKPTANPA